MSDTLSTILSKIDLRNFSGEISGILKDELKKSPLPKDGISKELEEVLQNKEVRNKYVLQYQEQLQNTFATLLPKEIILQVDKDELGIYVNNGLKKFGTSTGGKFVDEILSPALSASVINFAEDSLRDFVIVQETDLINLANVGFSYLTQQGVRVKEVGQEEIAKGFLQIKEFVPFNGLNETIFSHLIDQANDLIKNKPQDMITTLQGDLRKKFTESYLGIRQEAEKIAQNAFVELGKGIKTLTDNENDINDIIDKLKEDINSRESQVKELEDDINSLLKSGFPDLNILGQKQLQHAKIVAENLFCVNFLDTYLKKGIGIIDSLDDYKDKASKILSGQYLQEFSRKLEVLKKPSFSGVVSFASATANTLEVITGTMEKLGVFKGAAKSVGKFINYAKVAIGIATALIPPNPIGIIGALGSLGGLFGGGGPSVEEQMFQAMQEGFNQINERLDQIESKINKLSELIQGSYKNIMQSLQGISNQLKNITEQLELNTQLLNYAIYKDYNLVEVVIEGKNDFSTLTGLELYRRWYAARQLTIVALSELGKLTESSRNLNSVVRSDFIIPGLGEQFGVIAKYELQSYNATLILFKKIFDNIETDNKAKNLLLIPPQKNQFDTFQQGYNLILDRTTFSFEAATENYLNPYFISKIASQYITLHPFFILSKNNQFEPLATINELLSQESQEMIKDKLGPSKGRLTNLLTVINYSIIQQNILSGCTMMPFINAVLFGNNDSNFQFTVDALKANELLGKNLATYFINTKISKEDLTIFSDLYYQVRQDPQKIKDLNALLKYGQGRLEFGFDDLNPANPLLCLFFTKPGSAEKIRLLLSDLTLIQEEQMIDANALTSLIAVKEKVITALIDIGFFQGLSDSRSNLYKEVFFSQS